MTRRARAASLAALGIATLLPLPAAAQAITIRGQLAEPLPDVVQVFVRYGRESASCEHRPRSPGPATLCTATVPADYAVARVEIAAKGFESWSRNVFLDGPVVDLGPIQLRKAAPKDLAVSARRLRIRGSAEFLVEAVAENLSTRALPIESIVLEGAQPWGVSCNSGAPVNPWQPLTFDWGMIRNPAAAADGAWTVLRGEEISVRVRFRPANCGDYSHRLEATVPLTISVPPGGVERIVLRISEIDSAQAAAIQQLPPLSEWQSLAVTVHARVDGTPVTAQAAMARE